MGLRVLALACLAGAAFAGPYKRDGHNECAKECNPSPNQKFEWEVGKAYLYHVKAENNVTYTGSQSQKSSVEGTMEYHIDSQCQVVLKLRNVKIDQKLTLEGKEDLKKKLEIPLAFARKDDDVEHICPSPEESTQSLNIKKAMISSFINSMLKLDTPEETETYDSLGKCKTKYTPTYEDGLVIRVEKNLKSCTNKHTLLTPFIKTQFPSSLIFEDDSLVCKQYVQDKIVNKVECNEKERMKPPIKDKSSWIEFSSNLLITFIEKKPVEHFDIKEDGPQEEILYGIEETRKGDSNGEDVENFLKTLCPKNIHVVDIGVSSDFTKLGQLAKSLPYEELDRIYESLKNGKICDSKKVKDLFVDTLPMIGTEAAVKLMAKLIQNQDITGLKAKMWPASFALIQKPTKEMVSAAIPLVKMDCSPPVMLGISAMIHRICTSEGCESVEPVNEVVSVFNEYIGEMCSSDDDDKALSALKAFGNMGYHGKARKNIIACIQDNSKSNRMRLAAIDSFRRIDEKRPDEFIDQYSKNDEDHEIRIAAFASACKHADIQQLQKIKQTAESETDPQVGAYVSSYIKNIKKTSSPTKQKVKKLLQKIQSQLPKFKFWENSKNIEMYGFNKALNVGGGIEADIIHSSESKIPRSISTRFDVDIFDKPVNLLQFGIRAEGLEKIVQRVVGLKDSLPKESSWDLFSSKGLMGNTDAEMSLFLRTFNTEIFDASGSDLSGIGEMVRIADMMNTLAKGNNADFSHSFNFMNSKLVIPSVTGRSYSVDFTGSSTVGVTARSKADIVSFPRHADVHLHFQPSVNLEMSTTVGIQSNRLRPDIKLVSRLHLESNMEAKFHVKDGHVAVASLTLPSENIMMAKLSTDLVNIDENHNEKRIFVEMQKKVDHCFKKLHKPLGITACAVVKVPKPLVTRSFPYLLPFGNGEFVLKKSDDSFSSYVMHLEIPKHSGPQMKYKASLDTPGSKISRRFAADFDVTQQTDNRQISVEITTPFKTAGGSVSLTKNDKLIHGEGELHSDSKQMMYANFTLNLFSSRTRKNCQISAVASYKDQEPVKVNGSITVSKGRKHHLDFDFNLDKPNTKPVTIKGAFRKEGRVELSSRSEWKLSSEIKLNSPHGHLNYRSTIDKKFKQIQAVSVNMGIDYQKIGEKEYSATFSSTSQKSAEKINTFAKFETTQYPKANWHLKWNVQRESKYSIKNNVSLSYGQNPEKNYISLKQVSRIPQLGRGENSAHVEIPQLNINCEVSVKHNLEMGTIPKFQVDADLRYNHDEHSKGRIDLEYHSEGPLKASGKFEIEHDGRHYIYEDEIAERSDNEIVGNSRLQYEEGKVIQLKYNYKRLSDDSKIHHEIKSSLQTPSSPSPIESKVSLRINSESLDFAGHVGSIYSIQAHSNERVIHAHVKHPSLEGKLKVNNMESMKNISLDLTLKGKNPRHIKGLFVMETSENKKGFHLEIIPDIDHRNDLKIAAHSFLEISKKPSGDTYKGSTKLEVLDLVYAHLNESGRLSGGDYACIFECIAPGFKPIKAQYKTEKSEETGASLVAVSIENTDVVKIQLDASWKNIANKRELSVNGSLTSPINSFENIDVNLSQQLIRSGPSTIIQSHLYFKKNEKVYKAEWNSNLQPNGVELKAAMHTPHANYERQSLGVTIQRSSYGISSSMNIEIPNNKVFSITTEIKKNNRGLTVICKIIPPSETKIYSDKELKDILIKLVLTTNDHRNRKSLNSLDIFVLHDNSKVAEIKAHMSSSSQEFESEVSTKVFNSPSDKFQELSMKYRLTKSSVSASGNIQLTKNKEISLSSEFKKEGNVISTTSTISAPYRNFDAEIHLSAENQSSKKSLLSYIDVNGQRKGDAEFSITSSSQDIEIKGGLKSVRLPEISVHVKCEKTEESSTIFANIIKSKSTIFSASFKRLSHADGEKILIKTRRLEKTILDLEVSKDESRENSKKYSFKVSGEFPAVSVTFLKSYNDPTSVSTELRVCQEVHQTECYSLKSYHKNMLKSHNYRFYQKLTMDLEKSFGGSSVEAIGSLQLFLNQDEYDSGSKVILQSKDKKVGYEMKFHRRQHQNDHHSFVANIFLPHHTSRFRALILHNSRHLKLELNAIPNTEDPTRKFGVDMKRDINPESKEVSGYIKIDHPTRSEPFLFTYKLERVDETFVKGKMLLHYSTVYGKTLNFEFEPNLDQESYGIRSMVYKLYTQDKSLDAHLKLIKESSRQEDKIGYEWKYNSDGDEKMGGVLATLYDKKAGKPKSAKIKYYGSSTDYEVHGSIAQAPEDATFILFSRGQKLKELRIKIKDSCLDIELNQSGPLMKSSLCVNKREGAQLVTADIYCHQRKCFDARLYLDPQKPGFVTGKLKWDQQEIIRSLREVIDYDRFQGIPLRKIVRELKEKLVSIKRDIQRDIQDKLQRGIKRIEEIEERISRKVRRIHKWHSDVIDEHLQSSSHFAKSFFKYLIDLIPVEYFTQQVIKPIHDATRCFFREYFKLIVDHIPQFIGIVMQVTKAQFEHCLKKFCVQGTFCHDIFLNYQQNGLQAAQDLYHEQISEVKEYLKWKIPSMTFPDFIKLLHSVVQLGKKQIENMFGKFVGDKIISKMGYYFKEREKILRQKTIEAITKAIDKVIDNINSIFNQDEDYRIAKSLAADVKKKLTDIWRNKEKIAKQSVQAVQEDIKQNAKKMIQEQIQVQKFDPKEGDIQFTFRQPLGPVEVQILKNELRSINRKLEEYLRN